MQLILNIQKNEDSHFSVQPALLTAELVLELTLCLTVLFGIYLGGVKRPSIENGTGSGAQDAADRRYSSSASRGSIVGSSVGDVGVNDVEQPLLANYIKKDEQDLSFAPDYSLQGNNERTIPYH